MPVAGEKLLETKRSRRMRRADEDHVAEPLLDESDPAQEERAHEDLAQIGVELHQCPKVLPLDRDHFTWLADAGAEQDPAAREHVEFAGEVSGAQDENHACRGTVALDDFHCTGGHDERVSDLVARSEEDLAGGRCPSRAVRGHPVQLCGGERRQHRIGPVGGC